MNQNFVGSEKVGQFPKGATMQLDVNKVEQAEQDRLAKRAENPGAAKRAAVANRNPAEYWRWSR
ncbi:hypothetical protein WG66_009248 [Moniliophthora roreri]|uniref:Uncharacterized protein n=1 Tax=Moniliophthora roreri TaxID=221103 RepID=A0A0W0F497_MONRR|nr:hypothetical protein WG66_009248 [Moniliophthora roreri]